MNCEEILGLVKQGESTTIEFKESTSDTLIEGGLETTCAFINTNGGVLIFGINKKGDLKGVVGDLDEIKQRISSKIKNGFYPRISALYSLDQIICDDSKLLLLEVLKDKSNIYSYKEKAYIRNGSVTTKLSPHEVVDIRKRLESGIKEIAPNVYTKVGPSVKRCTNCGYNSISGFESVISIGGPTIPEKCPRCGSELAGS